MFYENQRIVRKQQVYVKSRAYQKISHLERKGLSDDEIIGCLNVLLAQDNNETQVDILNLAHKIVTSRQEKANEEDSNSIRANATNSMHVTHKQQDSNL